MKRWPRIQSGTGTTILTYPTPHHSLKRVSDGKTDRSRFNQLVAGIWQRRIVYVDIADRKRIGPVEQIVDIHLVFQPALFQLLAILQHQVEVALAGTRDFNAIHVFAYNGTTEIAVTCTNTKSIQHSFLEVIGSENIKLPWI